MAASGSRGTIHRCEIGSYHFPMFISVTAIDSVVHRREPRRPNRLRLASCANQKPTRTFLAAASGRPRRMKRSRMSLVQQPCELLTFRRPSLHGRLEQGFLDVARHVAPHLYRCSSEQVGKVFNSIAHSALLICARLWNSCRRAAFQSHHCERRRHLRVSSPRTSTRDVKPMVSAPGGNRNIGRSAAFDQTGHQSRDHADEVHGRRRHCRAARQQERPGRQAPRNSLIEHARDPVDRGNSIRSSTRSLISVAANADDRRPG